MMDADDLQFDEVALLALAHAGGGAAPRPAVREQLLEQIGLPATPTGFRFRFDDQQDWLPHPVPGIRMRVLSLDHDRGYATLLLDVAPGTTFPPHHHQGAEECYVISGTVRTCGREMKAGDFLHADGGTEHGELYSPTGCRVLLVVPADEDIPPPPR